MKEIFKDDEGKTSASRTPMLLFAALLIVIWVGIGVSIAFFGLQWSQFSGWLQWGRDFFFGTVVAYVGGKVAGRRTKNGNGGGQGS